MPAAVPAGMTRQLAFAVALVGAASVLSAIQGCSSTSSNRATADGSAMFGDEDGGLLPIALCSAAGGQCVEGAFDPDCTPIGPDAACNPDQIAGSFCCALDGGSCPWPNIKASHYDQSCTVDSDCVGVAEGDPCGLCAFACYNAAVKAGDPYDYYLTDIANTTANLSSQRLACYDPGCAYVYGPCCIAGTCQMGARCGPSFIVGDAAAETGGSDAAADSGPLDAGSE
jgi:hypothetical protein